jgi:hypothetical protein
MAKDLKHKSGEEILVTNKFFKEYTKTKAKLKNTRKKGLPPAKISVLKSRMKDLNRQLALKAKKQKERPERYRAEVRYGGVSANGNFRGSKSRKFLNYVAIGLSAGASAFFVSGAVAATVLTGGVAAVPAIALATLMVGNTVNTVKSALDDIKTVDKVNARIKKEDSAYALQQENRLQQQSTSSYSVENNTNIAVQSTHRSQNTSTKELENQIKNLTSQINSLKEQLKQEQASQQKEPLLDFTVVVNKNKKPNLKAKRKDTKTTQTKRSNRSVRTV